MNEVPSSSGSRLGRGLGSMVQEVAGIKTGSAPAVGGFLRIPLADIREPEPGRRPDAALVESVRKFGVLQPVLVARQDTGYDLLAGSRRLQAAKAVGMADIPALIIPPDRAGSMDVYLEENLARAELQESDRIRLRDRWMRETGRDLAQAEERIPEVQWESTPVAPVKPPGIWKIAAVLLAVVSTGLLFVVFNTKPVDRRPVVIPVEFVQEPQATEPAPPDNGWMDAFIFPGDIREIKGDRLHLIFLQPMHEGSELTPRGRLVLNQLAAVVLASEKPLHVEIQAPGPATAAASAHLSAEGMAPERITARPARETSFLVEIHP